MILNYREAAPIDINVVTDLLFKLYNDEGQSPDLTWDELFAENEQIFMDENHEFFLALEGNKSVGIGHGSLRYEYVNGANDGTKGYLEAIYVLPEYRRKGVAAELAKCVEQWAASKGCCEIASDCLIDNIDSYHFHTKIGFAETERCIFFLKEIEKNV